jgi:hypothetical protein
MSTLYTNTSKVGAVIGLVVTTVAVTYASQHSTEIVNGTLSLAKKGIDKANSMLHKGKKQYSVCTRMADGRIVDTGERLWK